MFSTRHLQSVSNNTKVWKDFAALKSEEERLKTFEHWQLDFISAKELAKDGFYFTREQDKVQCVFCHGVIGSWELNDKPHSEHAKFFPDCMFINGIDVGNVPLESLPEKYGITMKETDVCGSRETTRQSSPSTEDLRSLGIDPHSPPAQSDYAGYDRRLKSFDTWPLTETHSKESLAQAGFFYTGVSDHVKCFFCDGGLRNWDKDDDPVTEHIKWFPTCKFLIDNDFVAQGPSRVNQAVLVAQSEEHPTVVSNNPMPSISFEDEQANTKAVSNLPSSPRDENQNPSAPSLASNSNDRLLCKICMQDDIGVVFLPCGHLASCRSCAYSLVNCPVCRQPIKGTVRTFIS